MNEQWIEIVGWDRFQHYRNRSPLWIKNYTALTSDDNYLGLTGHRRAVLHGLWLEYALSGSCLRVDPKMIGSRLRLVVKMNDLEALNQAGFITFSASTPLAERYPRSRERSRSALTSTTTETGSALPSTSIEADSSAPTALPIEQTPENDKHPLTQKLLAEIQDADKRTEAVLGHFEDRLFENEFALALESLQHRRSRADLPPLSSEARYVVATLSSIEQERRS